jgi:hypothetical protein
MSHPTAFLRLVLEKLLDLVPILDSTHTLSKKS